MGISVFRKQEVKVKTPSAKSEIGSVKLIERPQRADDRPSKSPLSLNKAGVVGGAYHLDPIQSVTNTKKVGLFDLDGNMKPRNPYKLPAYL